MTSVTPAASSSPAVLANGVHTCPAGAHKYRGAVVEVCMHADLLTHNIVLNYIRTFNFHLRFLYPKLRI